LTSSRGKAIAADCSGQFEQPHMPNEIAPQTDSTLTIPVKHFIKGPPIFVASSANVAQAAQVMQSARVGSALVMTEPPGIVTDRDLRGRVLAQGLGPDTPITQIMTQPLKTIDSDSPAFAALRLMLEENIHHIPIVEEGKIIGVISSSDLLFHQATNPIYLRGVIDDLEKPADLAHYGAEIAALVEALFRSGLGAIQISHIVSTLNDALVKRLIALTLAKFGPAPAPYSWIVFGSEGRLEQTLLTDQDNALIYAEESGTAHAYFAAVAKEVVDGLIQAGFPPCAGGFMATNWCKPVAAWQELFTQWTRLPKPDALLDAAIFFDFRAVAGSVSVEPLEQIIAAAKSQKLFLAHMARGALDFYPPLGFFNRLRSEDGKVDLKRGGIAPVVALARVGALAAGSRERSTLERLRVVPASGAFLSSEDATALGEIFPFLFNLRLQQQLNSMATKRAIDHTVPLAELSNLTRRHLKEAFAVIKRIQDAVRAAWQLDRLA
jgi:CBS domain-containing protein